VIQRRFYRRDRTFSLQRVHQIAR